MSIRSRLPVQNISTDEFRHFFLSHLHRIYCAKSELTDKLPLLGEQTFYRDLQQAIEETVQSIFKQLKRLEEIYQKMHSRYHPDGCIGVIGVLKEAFQSVGAAGDSPALNDLSLIFYMQHIESIEMASFKVMMMIADKLELPDVKQLLLECYDEAREDKILFKAIMSRYL